MESAIPEHLRTLRRCSSAMPEEHKPPYPAWTARFSPLTGRVVMAYFGIQGRNCPDISALDEVTDRFSSADCPGHWDIASCKDHAGFYNLMAIAYWPSAEQFERWKQSSLFHKWWNSPERENGEYGFFLEIVSPQPESFETIFSDKASPEGVARLAEGMSGEIREHGYFLRNYFTQSSSTRPGTRANSRTLFVTRTAPAAMACPAMAVSFGPIGVPARRSATRMSVVASTAARSQGRMASRRAQNASTS